MAERAIRYGSLIWPFLLLAVTVVIAVTRKNGSAVAVRYVCLGVVAVQAVFLVASGIKLPDYSASYFPSNQDMMQVKQIVGNDLLGTYSTGSALLPNGLGFLPETNIAYHVRQFTGYDPTLPNLYYQAWAEANGNSGSYAVPLGGLFSPGVTSVQVAREFGIQYLIGPPTTEITLVNNLTARIDSALRGTQFDTPTGQAAVASVLNTYLIRPDVQAAVPWTGPLTVRKVFAWAAQYGIDDTPALLPYASVIKSLSAALTTSSRLQLALGGLVTHSSPPPGFVQIKTTSSFTLYEVPGSSQFSFDPSNGASDVLSVTWVNNYTCKVVVDASTSEFLISRIADVPGWHATINGRSSSIAMRDNLLQQVAVPAGRDTIVLTYWPSSFTNGLKLAAVGLLWLLSLLGYAAVKNKVWTRTQKLTKVAARVRSLGQKLDTDRASLSTRPVRKLE
ncbi:MAG: YfhO family protein [Ktedonobacterales bacterium]